MAKANLDNEHTPEPISRSARKRDARVLFELGQQLVAMTPADLHHLPLPESIAELVEKTRAISSHVAHKRELQYLAKQLRHIDAEPLLTAVADYLADKTVQRSSQHRIEAWREYLLDAGQAALNQLTAAYPNLDRQRVRSLQRKALVERERALAPASARQLFRLLRELNDDAPLPAPNQA